MARLLILTFMSFLLLAGCGNNQKENNMAITVDNQFIGQ